MSCILWNSKVDHIHNRPPSVPMLSHINQGSAILPYFFDINFNIILPSMNRSAKLSVTLQVSPPKFGIHFCSLV